MTGTRPRAQGAALLLGAAGIALLIEADVVAYHWFPLLVGLTFLGAAVAGASPGPLWGPGVVVTAVGLAVGLWLQDGRSGDSFQLLALTVLALGLGGVLAALLEQARGVTIGTMGVALPVLLFGAFALGEQQQSGPFAGRAWPYAVLLALWGLWALRPRPTPPSRSPAAGS
jgi:hypothetical protein